MSRSPARAASGAVSDDMPPDGLAGVAAVQTSSATLAEKLATEIGQGVIDGAFAPGVRLDETMLAERYNVSRTPVREALRQLAATGLIEMRPRRGAVVSVVTTERLGDLFVAMAEIEASCARLAAMSMNPIERKRLEALHKAMGQAARAGEEQAYADANREFHLTIYAGAHNVTLLEIATALRRRLDPFRRAQFRAPDRLKRSHAEHEAVVRAIVGGDAGEAHKRMLDHVTLIEDAFDGLKQKR